MYIQDPWIMTTEIFEPSPIVPDVVVSWPRNCDYPTWRAFIKENRIRFGKVVVVFTETNSGENYKEFVRNAMAEDDVLFLENPRPGLGEDWRDLSTNTGLAHCNSDWIWFTEQDFLITDEETFWKEVYAKSELFDMVAITQSGRIHPACIFISRFALQQTRMDFGIDPGKGDHFCKFQEDVERLKISRCLLADEQVYGYKHYNGLSHNWHLVNNGQPPVYHPEEFTDWLKKCLELPRDIKLDVRFLMVAKRAITAYNPNT